jgi:hypothetical protein
MREKREQNDEGVAEKESERDERSAGGGARWCSPSPKKQKRGLNLRLTTDPSLLLSCFAQTGLRRSVLVHFTRRASEYHAGFGRVSHQCHLSIK